MIQGNSAPLADDYGPKGHSNPAEKCQDNAKPPDDR